MNKAIIQRNDEYLQKIKDSRKQPAVLKIKFTTLRSSIPNLAILILEGKEDKAVYGQWIARVRPDFRYEFFVCNGKRQLLALRASLHRDLGTLSRRTYFCMDRDFDDLCGQPAEADLLMTDRYSIENYLVESNTLNRILIDYLHCEGYPDIRISIIKKYEEILNNFLQILKDINFILFVSKKTGIEIEGSVDKIQKIINIELNNVSKILNDDSCAIKLKTQQDKKILDELMSLFDELSPKLRYRGKFILMFFQKWLTLLCEERVSRNTNLFGQLPPVTAINTNEISLAFMASTSPLPQDFNDFVNSMESN